MRIESIEITKINPAKYNPRKDLKPGDPEYEKLKRSIREFDIVEPLVWNERTGNLVGGHQRLKVLQELGYTEVEVSVVDMNEAKEKALNVALNKISGDWDMDKLKDVIDDLSEQGFDLDLTGFDASELDDIMQSFKSEGEIIEDEVPDPPEEPVTKPGDLWILGSHRLLCGDATVQTDVDKMLDGVKPLLMVTDPPYGVNYDADWRNRAERKNGKPIGGRAIGKVGNDDNADWRDAWALFPGDIAYVWHAGNKAHISAESLEFANFEIRAQIVWVKNNMVISRGHYHGKHEPCWYAVRKNANGNWCGDRKQTTVWEIDKPQKSETGHSTQKPVECMARPIRNNSNEGQAVYDPFGGSGTTLVAAEQLNRTCYMMELDPKYVDVIIERWENLTGQKAQLKK